MKKIQYLTDHYDARISKINELNAPLNFIFITDQHNEFRHTTVEAVESMKYILERCPGISCVISGGDIANDYDPSPDGFRKSFTDMMDALYSLPVPVHCCIGNHDDRLGNCIDNGWDTRTAILPKEMHGLCMKYNPTEENYYYTDIDISDGGYRMVFLNSSDKPYYTDENGQYPFGWRLEFSAKQAEWFENDALITDRKIIIFCHTPLSNAGIYGSDGLPDGIKPYDDTLNAPRVYYHAKNCKNVVAIIVGHVHYDNIHYDGDLPTVSTLSAYRARWDSGCPERKIGAYTETAFDVMSIKNGKMYVTRFGAGNDRNVALLRLFNNNWTKQYNDK